MEEKLEDLDEKKVQGKKNNKGLIVLVVLLLVVVLGLSGYICYDKFFSEKEDATVEKKNESAKNVTEDKKNETTITDGETDTSKKDTNTANTVETRKCVGTYSGEAVVAVSSNGQDKYTGTITIKLSEDGSYDLKKYNSNGVYSGGTVGKYMIAKNVLLLGTRNETCATSDCLEEKYTQLLQVSDDCSSISSGIGSYFFDSNFKLTKQN